MTGKSPCEDLSSTIYEEAQVKIDSLNHSRDSLKVSILALEEMRDSLLIEGIHYENRINAIKIDVENNINNIHTSNSGELVELFADRLSKIANRR